MTDRFPHFRRYWRTFTDVVVTDANGRLTVDETLTDRQRASASIEAALAGPAHPCFDNAL